MGFAGRDKTIYIYFFFINERERERERERASEREREREGEDSRDGQCEIYTEKNWKKDFKKTTRRRIYIRKKTENFKEKERKKNRDVLNFAEYHPPPSPR